MAMKRFVAAIVIGLLGMGSALADVVNGGFEAGTPNDGPSTHWTRLSPGDTSMTSWTIASGNVDWFSAEAATACQGSRSVDLNGNTNGAISQSFATTPGASYRVTFCLAANTNGAPTVKTVDVSATGNPTVSYQFDGTGHTLTNMGWTTKSYPFVASGNSTTLTFASTTTVVEGLNAFGPVIDNVVVLQDSAIPTLTEWGIIALIGLLGMASLRALRRRHIA
jgi:choice-of-anchor C domain-containing protein